MTNAYFHAQVILLQNQALVENSWLRYFSNLFLFHYSVSYKSEISCGSSGVWSYPENSRIRCFRKPKESKSFLRRNGIKDRLRTGLPVSISTNQSHFETDVNFLQDDEQFLNDRSDRKDAWNKSDLTRSEIPVLQEDDYLARSSKSTYSRQFIAQRKTFPEAKDYCKWRYKKEFLRNFEDKHIFLYRKSTRIGTCISRKSIRMDRIANNC